jgi:pimeloyl-ACP methyl ester carboxylesterase
VKFLDPTLDGADVAARVRANGLELAYEQFGDDRDPGLLLILGFQLTGWPDAFCRALADTGLRVIRFDNRDSGLSSKIEATQRYDSPRAAFLKARLRRPIEVPYRLEDMADDTLGLMDALGLARAHVVGASLGGMIAQLVAALHPERALTLTSIMSSSGGAKLPRVKFNILLRLLKSPNSRDPEAIAQHIAYTMRRLGSPRYARSQADWASEIRRGLQRGYYPAGMQRQMLAMAAAASRVDLLVGIEQPALVIHGRADPLLPVKHGRDTARCLPNVRYEEIAGMGHDLPPRLLPRFVTWISELVQKSY